jgi:hypothetical protein
VNSVKEGSNIRPQTCYNVQRSVPVVCKSPSHVQPLWETMDKSVRDFILLVAVLCLSVGSEAGFFDNVSRYLTS